MSGEQSRGLRTAGGRTDTGDDRHLRPADSGHLTGVGVRVARIKRQPNPGANRVNERHRTHTHTRTQTH